MFGCLWDIIKSLFLIFLGAYLHAKWPVIRTKVEERLPKLLPALSPTKARTIVWHDASRTLRIVG